MSGKAFRLREGEGGRSEGRQCIGAAGQDARAFDKIENGQAGGKTRRARRWKNVVRTGHVVPDGLGCVTAQEYGACVAYPFE